MTKRIFLYGGVVLFTLALFVVLGDRVVTDRVPLFTGWKPRLVAVFLLNLVLGGLVRQIVVRRRAARLGTV